MNEAPHYHPRASATHLALHGGHIGAGGCPSVHDKTWCNRRVHTDDVHLARHPDPAVPVFTWTTAEQDTCPCLEPMMTRATIMRGALFCDFTVDDERCGHPVEKRIEWARNPDASDFTATVTWQCQLVDAHRGVETVHVPQLPPGVHPLALEAG